MSEITDRLSTNSNAELTMVSTQYEGALTRPQQGAQAPRRILVVEDDETVGRMMQRMLKSYGEVTIVNDPVEALRLLATEAFDVVTCDLVMPGISGFALLAYAREHCPETRRVLVTGSTLTDPGRDDGLFDARLLKPFSRAALAEAVLGEASAQPGRRG